MNINYLPTSFINNNYEKNIEIISGDVCEPISSEDENKLKTALLFIRIYYNLIKDDPETFKDKEVLLYHRLNYVNNLLNRNKLYNIAGIKKNNIVPILLKLSIVEHKEIHACSLSILATLTYCLPEIINDLIDNCFYDSININLQLPFFPEKRHVFRWIYNFLINHSDSSQLFFEKVSIYDIYQSAIEYVSYENNSFPQVMFLHISLLNNLTIDQIQTCILFYNYCLNKPNLKGIHNVLYGIHKIISKTSKYPIDLLSKFVIDLNLENVIAYYIQRDKIDRNKCFSFCLLGDLFELGFQNSSNLIPFILQTIEFNNLPEWYLKSAIKTIRKILYFCNQDLVSKIFETGIFEKMLDISIIEVYYCFCLFLNRLDESQLLNFLSIEYVELICTIILSDDIDLINLAISGFIRFVQITEMNKYLIILADYFLLCDGFCIFEERFSTDDVISVELISQLQQYLYKLSRKTDLIVTH